MEGPDPLITTTIARRLLGVASRHMGARSTGAVLARASSADVVVEPGEYLAPLVNGAIDYQRLVVVAARTTVTSAGTTVPCYSLLGGTEQNLPIGTVRWDPPIAGLAPTAEIVAPFTGGLTGTVKHAGLLEQLTSDAARDLFVGKVARYPAILIAWESSGSYRSRGESRGETEDTWRVYVVVSRADASERRAREGLDILDELEALLFDRHEVDGLPMSARGIEIRSRDRLAISPLTYVYRLTIATTRTVITTELATATPWNTTRVDVPTDDGLPVVDNNLIDMVP